VRQTGFLSTLIFWSEAPALVRVKAEIIKKFYDFIKSFGLKPLTPDFYLPVSFKATLRENGVLKVAPPQNI
jgi:hypothetical protein